MEWHQRGSVSTLTSAWERGTTTGVFYLAGCVVVVFAMLDPAVQRDRLLLIAIGALVVGVASLAFARWFAMGLAHVAMALGPTFIGLGVINGGGELGPMLVTAAYTLVCMHIALLASPRGVVVHMSWAATTLVVSSTVVWPAPTVASMLGVFVAVSTTITVVTGMLVSRLRQAATTDPLTGLANRGALEAALAHAAATVERTQEPLSLLVLDLDGFKSINDRRGHAAGDALLRDAARTWSRHVRARDTLARLGGDEFAVVMPGADGEEARRAGRRLVAAVSQAVGCSIGVATWAPHQSLDELMAAADASLYADKARRTAALGGHRAAEAGSRL